MEQILFLAIRFASVFIFFLVGGCAKQHQIFLNPSLPIHDSKIGNKIPISLYVADSRSNKIIAKWKKGLRSFSIFSQNDLREIFSRKLQQGLIKLDFNSKIHRRNPNNSMKIEILEIRSKYKERIPKMDVWAKEKLRVTCINNGEKYSKTYSEQKNVRTSRQPLSLTKIS